jgi:hypothetical protein
VSASAVTSSQSSAAASSEQSSNTTPAQSGDASSSQSAETSASGSSSAQSASSASQAAEYSEQELTDALDACCSFESGTSGSSLQAISAASELVSFSAKNMSETNVKAIGDDIQKWYDALDADKKDTLKANWDEIYEDAQKLVADPASMKDALSDAGVTTDFASMDLSTGISAANCVNSLLSA